MISISLKDICKNTTNRDDGLDASLKLLESIYTQGPTYVAKNMENLPPHLVRIRIEWNGVIIDVPEQIVLSASFIDELIFRLEEKGVLSTFSFALHDPKHLEKFQKVSTNRYVKIRAIWEKEEIFIRPSGKTTHTNRKIIIRDL